MPPKRKRGIISDFNKNAPLANWITSASAVAISVVSLSISLTSCINEDNKRRIKSEIYMEATQPSGGCLEKKTRDTLGCRLTVKPADSSMKIIQSIVQYPASEFQDGSRHYDEFFGPPNISLLSKVKYLNSRNSIIYKNHDENSDYLGIIPISITSSYIYDGQKKKDTSFYHLFYAVINRDGDRFAVPGDLVFCGRTDRESHFLVDPWVDSVVGFEDRKSSSVLFECLGTAVRLEADEGLYKVSTGLSKQISDTGGIQRGSIPMSVKGYKYKPIGNSKYMRALALDIQ